MSVDGVVTAWPEVCAAVRRAFISIAAGALIGAMFSFGALLALGIPIWTPHIHWWLVFITAGIQNRTMRFVWRALR